MFKKKKKQIKTAPNKSNLEQVLWFIENYLPQKKDQGVQKKLYMNNFKIAKIIIVFLSSSYLSVSFLRNYNSPENIEKRCILKFEKDFKNK